MLRSARFLSAICFRSVALVRASVAFWTSCWAKACLASADAILSASGLEFARYLRKSSIWIVSWSARECSPAFRAERLMASRFLILAWWSCLSAWPGFVFLLICVVLVAGVRVAGDADGLADAAVLESVDELLCLHGGGRPCPFPLPSLLRHHKPYT